jgi:hypothetical protein
VEPGTRLGVGPVMIGFIHSSTHRHPNVNPSVVGAFILFSVLGCLLWISLAWVD